MKKLNTTNIIFKILLILLNVCYGQSNNNLEYFPHNNGDMWEYFYSDGPLYIDTAQVFNLLDSTDAAGNIYITQTSRYINPIKIPAIPFDDTIKYKIDTLNQVWAHFGEVEYGIAFKLNAKQGEKWILETHYDNEEILGYEMARVKFYNYEIFGNTYKVMNTVYFYSSDSTDTLGLSRYGEDLALGLGRVWKGGGDSPGRMDLIGAVINGILYGDTTNVITSINTNYSSILPSVIKIEQNYPNPFNIGTNIIYSINQTINLSIIIYNVKGEKIYELVENKLYTPGKYSSYWDGKNEYNQVVASGVYFYSIFQNSKLIKTKSMLLLK